MNVDGFCWCPQSGITPLSIAASDGHVAVVNILLAHSTADVNTVCHVWAVRREGSMLRSCVGVCVFSLAQSCVFGVSGNLVSVSMVSVEKVPCFSPVKPVTTRLSLH